MKLVTFLPYFTINMTYIEFGFMIESNFQDAEWEISHDVF
jgi:hypothetical protein